MIAIVPTQRAVILIALAAPVALIVGAVAPGAWIAAPALGIVLLMLVIGDALLAGRAGEPHLRVPHDVEVGATGEFVVNVHISGSASTAEAAIGVSDRLAPGGRLAFPLIRTTEGHWLGGRSFTPSRRGTGKAEHIWLRWVGPLGLGAQQTSKAIDQSVRVRPNIAAVRSPALQVLLRQSQFGLIARRIRGEGSEFESLTEYEPGMDRRRIDWKSSARHAHLFAKEYEAERNNQIVLAFDCGQAMCEPVAGLARIDRAVSAALLTAYVALKGGDKVSLYDFAARPGSMTPFVSGPDQFHRLQVAAAGIDYHAQEPNFTWALATLAGRLQRRSLVVVFSDFTDPTSAELMIESIGRLVSRHVVLFVTMHDEELESISGQAPDDMQTMAMAVTADSLLRQRALVLQRLRQLGVDVIEAKYDQIGPQLIDAYLNVKRAGAIG